MKRNDRPTICEVPSLRWATATLLVGVGDRSVGRPKSHDNLSAGGIGIAVAAQNTTAPMLRGRQAKDHLDPLRARGSHRHHEIIRL